MISSEVRKQKKGKFRKEAYHTIKSVYVIIGIGIFFVSIIVIFKQHVIFERLASEVVDSTRYDLQTSMEGEKDRKRNRGSDGTHFLLDVSPI